MPVNLLLTKFLALFFAFFQVPGQTPVGIFSGGAQTVNGFSHVRTITTNHLQAGTADSTNYKVTVAQTLTDLKTTGNGGSLTNANGFDHIYTSDSGCTTLLKWDSSIYVATTGQIVDHVTIATLSHTADNTFYLCYAKASISTFQGNTNGTWTDVYTEVKHLVESTNPYADSTGNGFGSTSGTNPTQQTTNCAFGYCQSFVQASSQYIANATSIPDSIAAAHISMWMQTTNAYSAPNGANIFSNFGSRGFAFFYNGGGTSLSVYCNAISSIPTSVTNDANWHFIVAERSGSTNWAAYVDGVQIGTTQSGCNASQSAISEFLGTDGQAHSIFMTVKLQEFRTIANGNVSTSWITADYNSQKPSSTFLTVGAASP